MASAFIVHWEADDYVFADDQGVSGNAANSGISVGDTVIYTSSFFGDELWPADKLGFTRSAIGACPSPVCFVYVSHPPPLSTPIASCLQFALALTLIACQIIYCLDIWGAKITACCSSSPGRVEAPIMFSRRVAILLHR